jgi:hypothetical protein
MAGLLISFYAFVIHGTVAASRMTVKKAVADVETAKEEAHTQTSVGPSRS